MSTASSSKKLVVAGALGVVGRAVVERFAERTNVEVVGLARRLADFAPRVMWVSADLRDPEATRRALEPHRDATHLVYAALNEQPDLVQGWRDAGNAALNTQMLQHTLEAFDGAPLQHVSLLQGTKAYGVHTGRPMRVPAREQDALRDHTNFYFDQQDLVEQHAQRSGFAWTAWRPQIVLGVALGSAMNPVAALGVYAAIQRERGLPLQPVGHPQLLTECTDARLIAEAIEWSWDRVQAHGRAFNIANGDVILWSTLWPRLAQLFGMALGEPSEERLRDVMPAQATLWRHLTEREGLRVPDLDALMGLSWQYAEATFAARRPLPVPPIVSTVQLRQAGFPACIDTEECIIEHLQTMQAQRYLPR
ncbi:MAG: NAD(P)H-binding protein [Pseudorhodobacter sp.]|nr:NAD(P)H-binding protein [Rhizobacter sp.]